MEEEDIAIWGILGILICLFFTCFAIVTKDLRKRSVSLLTGVYRPGSETLAHFFRVLFIPSFSCRRFNRHILVGTGFLEAMECSRAGALSLDGISIAGNQYRPKWVLSLACQRETRISSKAPCGVVSQDNLAKCTLTPSQFYG